jgi:hypothetical protein
MQIRRPYQIARQAFIEQQRREEDERRQKWRKEFDLLVVCSGWKRKFGESFPHINGRRLIPLQRHIKKWLYAFEGPIGRKTISRGWGLFEISSEDWKQVNELNKNLLPVDIEEYCTPMEAYSEGERLGRSVY